MLPTFELTQIASPSELEAEVNGPGTMNRLFIYTGIARVVLFEDRLAVFTDVMNQATVRLNLSLLHRRVFAGGAQVTQAQAIAGLAAIHGTSRANDTTWAITTAGAGVDPIGSLLLTVDLAAQGTLTSGSFPEDNSERLQFIGYQVNVLTSAPTVQPRVIRLRAPSFERTTIARDAILEGLVRLTGPAPRGGVVVSLFSNHPDVSVSTRSVKVAEGYTEALFSVRANRTPANVNDGVEITAAIPGARASTRLKVVEARQ